MAAIENVQKRSLEGKLAIVTGASRGIGAAVCQNLAAKGCHLMMCYTSASSAQRTADLAAQLVKEHAIKAHTVSADMGSEEGPAQIVTATREHFGHQKSGDLTIHIIINNAAVAGNLPLSACTPQEFQRQYTTNVLGPLLLVKAALPYLPTDRSGRIVNLSSVSASMGFERQSIYGGTKAALEAMTRTWARELKTRCTVNSVNPGPVATEMYNSTTAEFQETLRPWCETTPLAQVDEVRDGKDKVLEVYGGHGGVNKGGRAAEPGEIAGVVGMLCSSESGWCTGSVICANGGMRMSP